MAQAAFVHFGLGKCASTFLQGVWSIDPRYTAVNLGQAATAARRLATAGQTENLPRFELGVKPKAGTTMVASSEGFSWDYLRRPALQGRIPDLHRISAFVMGQSGLSQTALFMVRNPVDWVRAAHEQLVKEGDSLSGPDFVSVYRALIEHVLDLRFIADTFGAQFRKLVFLSADELREDPDAFWSRYAKALKVPKPERASIEAVERDAHVSNRSLKDRLHHLAALNRQFNTVAGAWDALEGLPEAVQKERAGFRPQYDASTGWATRRLAEFAEDETLARLSGLAATDPDFVRLPLDEALRQHLLTRFCDVLDEAGTMAPETVTGYRAALAG